jgi:hypothetical protein
MTNTKERHLEILSCATEVLEAAGGVLVIDELPQEERTPKLREMANDVKRETNCHIDTAKRNLAKAMRRRRFELMKVADPDRWGGERTPSGGRPKHPE